MLKNIYRHIFKKKENFIIQSEGLITITFWTAGVKYESRLKHILNCKIHEKIKLVREPKNEKDSNAIHVKRLNGESLGYVGMSRAALIAPLIDKKNVTPRAVIIDLKCDLEEDVYGVKIAMKIDSSYANMFTQKVEVIDFLFEKSTSGHPYLLLNCEETILNNVKELFKSNDISVYRSGISYKIAKNGKNYDWYLLLDEEQDEKFIQKILEERFPVIKQKLNKKFNEEYLELQEEELDSIKMERSDLLLEKQSLQKKVDKYERSLSAGSGPFEKFIQILFPNVKFIDPSIEFLQEIQDFSKAINEIKKIVNDKDFKGKRINTQKGWFDTHFNTGVKDDGRIYFNRKNSEINILVSLKSDQKKDLKRLSKYK